MNIKTWTDVGAAGEEMKHRGREVVFSKGQQGTNTGEIYSHLLL